MALLRIVFLLAISCQAAALVPSASFAASRVSSSRVASASMFLGSKKAAPKKAKKVAKKVVKKSASGTKGKGGIFPWVTNEPGTYAELPMLSSFDFVGGDGEKFTAGAPVFALSKFLYPKNTRK
mmetsp:Transcript_64661/g.107434  ORF Transcript_64661/g.107434 Transcript_64661/m.107434 type:complete len:124 (+) Transcript_64661:42-413(+)|eukprot:CAMPEP_0119301726 /NCGR_PEP_ID=MMETSP1333-20130426/3461_1 /TAXON_ID=418940 /ORGANISM="Scyphosphaera apsteinii, Strain RCC1455" /LENGTH=123 /DNA_ID=CAMNT_0007303885 /DNA_START=19 /DNA_END=390 /DNA_ORIENTATION=-